jgi:hypothetical protein
MLDLKHLYERHFPRPLAAAVAARGLLRETCVRPVSSFGLSRFHEEALRPSTFPFRTIRHPNCL